MAHFAALELKRRGHRGAGRADRAVPGGLHGRSSGASSSARLVDGELLGVVSTDALELGIDIGALDAAICVTFPGTVASLRQMWGRAGRRGRGLAIYVAGEDALDQFFCRHPDEFLERPVEAAILDHENEQLYAAHLLCAAHEGAAGARRRGDARAALARVRRAAGRRRASCASAPGRHVRPAPRRRVPGGRVSRCAARAATRWRSSTSSSGEVIGDVDAGPRAVDRAPGRGLPARRAPVRGRARSQLADRPRVRARRSTATGTRSPSARPRRTSSRCWRHARRSA